PEGNPAARGADADEGVALGGALPLPLAGEGRGGGLYRVRSPRERSDAGENPAFMRLLSAGGEADWIPGSRKRAPRNDRTGGGVSHFDAGAFLASLMACLNPAAFKEPGTRNVPMMNPGVPRKPKALAWASLRASSASMSCWCAVRSAVALATS